MATDGALAECLFRRSAAMSGRRDRHIQDTEPEFLVIRGAQNGLESGADAGSQTGRGSASAAGVQAAELAKFPEESAHLAFPDRPRRG
jgi:hypothetical protein